MRAHVPVGMVLVLGCLCGDALAQPIPATEAGAAPARREIRNQIGASINNAGLQQTFEMSWRWPVAASSHPLRAGAHVGLGVVNVITPSMDRIGAWLQWAPLSVASVRLGAEPTAYFGTFHSLQTFASYDAPFDADTRNTGADGRAARGLRAYVTPAVQFKVRRVVVRSAAEVEWWRADVAGPLYYEPARDTLLMTDGDALVNATSVAMYQRERAAGGFTAAGVLHHLTRVFDAPQNRIQRLGLIGMHEFGASHFGLPHLGVTVTTWRYLDDPSKRGEWGAAVAVAVRSVR